MTLEGIRKTDQSIGKLWTHLEQMTPERTVRRKEQYRERQNWRVQVLGPWSL